MAFESLPAPLNVFRIMLHAPSSMRALLRLGGVILNRQKLDGRLRELAILRVATLSGARYEWTQHVPIAKACGATDGEIAAAEGGDLDALEGEANLVVRFTDECVRDVRVSDGTFEEARASFSPQEIVELVSAIGYYMLIARLLETFEVDLEPAPPELAESFKTTSR
jgi:alkylhydroperoxidase family enzyme